MHGQELGLGITSGLVATELLLMIADGEDRMRGQGARLAVAPADEALGGHLAEHAAAAQQCGCHLLIGQEAQKFYIR